MGDHIWLKGELCLFGQATNPGEFDSRTYYRSLGIGGKIRKAKVIGVRKSKCGIGYQLYDLREKWHKRLYKILPEREASIMATMLLGEKEGLDEETREVYQKNGIIHILSISGLHITLIGMGAFRLLRKCGCTMKMAAIVGGVLLLGYGILTGMSVSATRAIGMYIIRMGAYVFRRTYDLLTGVCLMAAISCTRSPECLMNSGFLLSYSAVLGPVLFLPALNKLMHVRKRTHGSDKSTGIIGKIQHYLFNGLMQSMLGSISISITTMPILLYFYYEIPLYSVFLNILVLPFMSILVGCGLIGMAVPGLGIFTTFSYWILQYYDALCNLFSKLPMSRLNPGCPSGWKILIYFCIWGLLVLLGTRGKKKLVEQEVPFWNRTRNRGMTLMLICVMVCLMTVRIRITSRVTFLDVGQGDCICVELKNGDTFLFDCGSSSRKKVGEYVLLPYLKYRGIQKLNAVFISHNDMDHRNGVDELMVLGPEEGIEIEYLYAPGDIWKGDGWTTENGSFQCLHPERGEMVGDNASSQCFFVELTENGRKLRILLTGDVEKKGETELISTIQEVQKKNAGINNLDILKVAHHGSAYSSSEALLEQIRPKIAVISCGRNNSYGHPHKETLQRLEKIGSRVVVTTDGGAITVESVDNGWKMHTFLED